MNIHLRRQTEAAWTLKLGLFPSRRPSPGSALLTGEMIQVTRPVRVVLTMKAGRRVGVIDGCE